METWRDELGLPDRGPYIAHYGRKGMKWGKNIFEENGQTPPSNEPKKVVEQGRLYNNATYAKYLPKEDYEKSLGIINKANSVLSNPSSDPRGKSAAKTQRDAELSKLNAKLATAYGAYNGQSVTAHPEKAFKESQMTKKPTATTATATETKPKAKISISNVGSAIADLFSGAGQKAANIYVNTPLTVLDETGTQAQTVAKGTTQAVKDTADIAKNVGAAAVAASEAGVDVTRSSGGAIADIAETVREITSFGKESIKRLFGNLKHDGVETDEHIEHWGIKSMKWGERRFRNYDGTLTPEGKARYYKRYGRTLESMTTEEIRAASERVRAEQEYISLVDKNYSIEKETERQARERIKDTIGIAASAGALILTAIKVKDALKGKPIKDK